MEERGVASIFSTEYYIRMYYVCIDALLTIVVHDICILRAYL